MQNPVAVTGATGFVGGHLLRALLAAGYPVRVLVRDARKLENVEQLDVVEGDLENTAALEKFVTGVDTVIHCAGAIAALDRDGFFKINQTGAGNVAMASDQAGVKHFILVSSLAAREAHLSDYAASKKAGEDAVEQIMGKDRLTIVRPPAVYGPRDKATLPLVKALTQNRAILPGRADQKISLIFAKDLADVLVHLVKLAKPSGEVFEVDDGQPGGYSFADLARLASEVQGKKIGLSLLPRPVVALAGWAAWAGSKLTGKVFILSPAKVHELYHVDWVVGGAKVEGWQAKVQFKEGFELALSWYRKNQWLPAGMAIVND